MTRDSLKTILWTATGVLVLLGGLGSPARADDERILVQVDVASVKCDGSEDGSPFGQSPTGDSEDEFYLVSRSESNQETISGIPDPIVRKRHHQTATQSVETGHTLNFDLPDSLLFEADMAEGSRWFLTLQAFDEDWPSADDVLGSWEHFEVTANGPSFQDLTWSILPPHGWESGPHYTIHLQIRRWRSWVSLGGRLNSSPVTGTNQDGRLESFALGTDNALYHQWQLAPSSPNWSGWRPLGGLILGKLAVVSNVDGRLEVFARGTDSHLYHKWQRAANSSEWSSWYGLGAMVVGEPVGARNRNGRLEVFARGPDGALYHQWQVQAPQPRDQVSPESIQWSGWTTLGGEIIGDAAVARNSDGRLEVFARGLDQALWHQWQLLAGSTAWSGWSRLGGVLTCDPAAGQNQDGRLEVFARGTDNALYHMWQWQDPRQVPAGAVQWSGWSLITAEVGISRIAVARNSDGRLEAFVRGMSQSIYRVRQIDANSQNWSSRAVYFGRTFSGDPVVAANEDGRLELFAMGSDRALYRRRQNTPGDWTP